MTHNYQEPADSTTNHEKAWKCTECGTVWDDYSFLDDERLWCPWCESSLVEANHDDA